MKYNLMQNLESNPIKSEHKTRLNIYSSKVGRGVSVYRVCLIMLPCAVIPWCVKAGVGFQPPLSSVLIT